MADDGSTLIADQTVWFRDQCTALGGVSGGIYADKKGFHNTVNNNLTKYAPEYSTALPILLQGPRNCARAFDWTFPEAQTKLYFRINMYCQRLMDASLAHDPRLRGLYEWFGTKDGANIGYNVYKDRPSSSDDTHDWHIHFSFITAYLLDWAGVQGVHSVLKGETLAAYLARGGKIIGGLNTMANFPDCKYGTASSPTDNMPTWIEFMLYGIDQSYIPNGTFDANTLEGLVKHGICTRGNIFSAQEAATLMSKHAEAIAKRVIDEHGKPGPKGDQGDPGKDGKDGRTPTEVMVHLKADVTAYAEPAP